MTERACADCFSAPSWIPNASPPEGAISDCSFGHSHNVRTWPTTAWIDSFARLFAIYEDSLAEEGEELHVRVQADWSIFSFTDVGLVRTFLMSAVPDHPLLVAGVRVRLRKSTDGRAADHSSTWARFSEEIRHQNRYFPKSAPNWEILEEALGESIATIASAATLYRGRLTQPNEAIPIEQMGAPPPSLAPPGRANPVGIPYLYLALESKTCVYETRVANYARIAIGTFRVQRDLKVLNLAEIDALDFFSTYEEIEDSGLQAIRVSLHRYLQSLGEELRRPVRSTDEPTDYIPTQYLCEMAKSLSFDGVLYSSSQRPGGRNVVLFNVDDAVCESVQTVVITSIEAEWETVPAPLTS
ncbi:RES family NAD+ phosphorylase [Microbacterium pygmaeum]|uniref:RES domain-containing protein n=1 Tax=Microbacterium pygmaeum TaxID=370764 RepID=A0A1G7XM81_9MICO|nr:RES family NAD+ phosphorylase [Microbacterium pygmaeum]SDG85191.1 RES domain-containing protein [Microbacterium pygmaeum]